jgi:hypothetical protein
MGIDNRIISLKKYLVLLIVAIFLSSSIFVGISIADNDYEPVNELRVLQPAKGQLDISERITSKQDATVSTNQVIYGDDWSEVINPDGSRTRSIGKPTYYRDGAYHPVDTTIRSLNAGDYRFGVEEGKYSAYFKEDITATMPVMVKYEGYELSMQFNELEYFDYQVNQYKTLPVRASFGWPDQNVISYQNILPDVDLEYNYGITQLKENFVLNDISNYNFLTKTGDETLDLRFDINIPSGLELWADGKKVENKITQVTNLELKDPIGNTIFVIPTPVIYEQNHRLERISGYYEISITEKGAELILKSPIDWLSDPIRQFPVVIDPIVKTNVYLIQNTGLWTTGNTPNDIYHGWYTLNGPDYMYGFMLFNLSTIPSFTTIYQGTLYGYNIGISGSGGINIIPYRVIEPWSEGSMPNSFNPVAFAEGHSPGVNVNAASTWYSWNITTLVQGWISGYYANYGVVITTGSPSGATANWGHLASRTEANPPYLVITYINNSLQIAPKIPDVIIPEDAPPKNIRLSNNEHRRFEKFNSKKSVSGNPPFWAGGNSELRNQMLYHPTDIGMGGIIDIISFNKSSVGTGSYENFSVRMVHTTSTFLSTTFENNYVGELVEVFNVTQLNVNQPINTWITLDIDNIFDYQPLYNLIVEIRYHGASGSNSATWATSYSNAHSLYFSNYYATTGNTLTWRNDIKFEIISTDEAYLARTGTSATSYPFLGTTEIRYQLLYKQEEIAKSGIIDKIYFDMQKNASGNFSSVKINISHTPLITLSNNFDYNRQNGTPIEILNTSKLFLQAIEEDWMEIDVDNFFFYNNNENLFIELTWSGQDVGSFSNHYGSYPSPSYNCRLYTANLASATGSLQNFHNNLKFKFKDPDLTWKVSGVNTDLIEVAPVGPVGDDRFLITPMPNVNGVDTVRFTLHDSITNWSTHQDIDIIVEPVNDPPMRPFNLTPGQKPYKEWYSGPIPISWEHIDIDSPQDNITLEYRLGPSGTWQKIFNSTDTGLPYPDPDFLWWHPPNAEEIYIRVSTFDGEYWSPWNVSQNPIGFDNISSIIQNVEILDVDKDNTEFVRDGHAVLIRAFLTEKFFIGINTSNPVFFANLEAFGGGTDISANLSDLPLYVSWWIDDVSTTPKNGMVPLHIWLDPLALGIDFETFANTTADNLPVEIHEPSITPETWVNHKDNIEFSVNISDDGSGVDHSTMQYQVWLDGETAWGPWINVTPGGSRGDYIIPKILLNLNEGGNNKVRTRAQDVIGNDYVESAPYTIKVDSTGVEYSEIGAGTEIWFKNTKVLAKINITDNVSGVKPSTIKFRNSTNGKGGYSNWTNVSLDAIKVENMGKTVICTIEVDFDEGISNYLQWYAEDHAGNPLESDHLNYKVDMTPPEFSNADPSNNGFINNYTYQCSIEVSDAVSGVNQSMIQYRISQNGVENYGSWMDATISAGTRAIKATAQGNFTDGDRNYIQWRAPDFAGNLKESIDYKITIDLTAVTFSNFKPVQTTNPATWSETEDVNCSISVNDATSDVDATTIEYRYSTDGNADSKFSAWKSMELTSEEDDKSITVYATIKFKAGDDNWVQWRAKDKAGNSAESDKYQIRVAGLDSDGDNMPDAWEELYDLDPNDDSDADKDGDKDGLTNLEEYQLISEYGQSTDPTKKDTDGDGASDGYEVEKGTNPFNNADTPPPEKDGDGKEAGFDYLWIIIIIIIIVVVLLILLLVLRRKKKPEEERPAARRRDEREEEEELEEVEAEDWEEAEEVEEEEGEYGEGEEEVGGWELAEDEEEDLEDIDLDEEEELEAEDEDFIDFDLEEGASAPPKKGKAPPMKKGVSKGKVPKGKMPKKPAKEEPEMDEFEEDYEEDEDLDLEPEPKEPSVIRHRKKPSKVKVPSKGKLPAEKKAAPATPPKVPVVMRLDESTTCNICLGVIKTGLSVIKCTCGKKYHDSCANRVGICPSCDTDLSNPTVLDADEPDEMTDDDLEAFDIDDDWDE